MVLRKSDKIMLPATKLGVSQLCEYHVIKHEKGGVYTLRATASYVEPRIRKIKKLKAA